MKLDRSHDEKKPVFRMRTAMDIYGLLIVAGGWFGAYTMILRGCNAQTGNVM